MHVNKKKIENKMVGIALIAFEMTKQMRDFMYSGNNETISSITPLSQIRFVWASDWDVRMNSMMYINENRFNLQLNAQ